MRYLRGTTDLVLCYQEWDLKLRGYSVVDWDGDSDESRSNLGYVFTLSRGVISWCSKKENCIAMPTMEVEYVAYNIAAQEAI